MTEAAERDAADATWRGLTRGQKELLLSTAAGAPIETDAMGVEYPLVADGLLRVGDGGDLIVTHAGRMLIQRRSHPTKAR